jgi:hypothetical protein
MGASTGRGGCEQSDLPGEAFYPCQSASLADQAVAHRLLGAALMNHSQLSKHAGIWFRNQGRRARSANRQRRSAPAD